MVDERSHVPVLLDEVVQALTPAPHGIYLDATYGRGGHVRAILERLGPNGRVIAMDRDPAAIAHARKAFDADARVHVHHAPFSMLSRVLEQENVNGQVNGALFDLGVSSPQLDQAERGFSFRADGALDMRMDPTRGESAAQWLERATAQEIERVVRDYGEERFARRVARAIVRARDVQPIVTTLQLADIVAGAVPTREPGQHPATRTFQALRIYVNRELEELEAALPQAVAALAPGGRLAVISFHSLEDRVVKRFFAREARGGDLPPDLPLRAAELHPRLRVVGKAVRAGAAEIARNPRARSAVLRVAERTAESAGGAAYA
jgi:16S rRNA (cytosine1402-N4)-methyltransferase